MEDVRWIQTILKSGIINKIFYEKFRTNHLFLGKQICE